MAPPALFTLAQTGLTANPMAAWFGLLLLGGVLLVGIAALIAGLVRWWRPSALSTAAARVLGVISSTVGILILYYDFFAFDRAVPAWIIFLSTPALIGGLLALWWSTSPGRRMLFFLFAVVSAAVALTGGSKAFLHSYRHDQLVRVAANGDIGTVERAIGEGADVETMSDCTLLGLAVGGGHLETVKALLKAGADPNHWSCGILEMAVVRGDKEIVRVLLAAGADAGAFVDVNVTLIDEARRRGSSEIVKMLEDAEHAH